MMYKFYLEFIQANPFVWEGDLPKKGEKITTHEGMYLEISDFYEIGNYIVCRTSRGSYIVKMPEKCPEQNSYVGVIRVKPEKGKPGYPLEFFDHHCGDDLTVIDNYFGLFDPADLELESVEEIWEEFYCVSIRDRDAKYYVIRVE